jgi:outer membrane protein OmpA-like peptidoglycan-associated protein
MKTLELNRTGKTPAFPARALSLAGLVFALSGCGGPPPPSPHVLGGDVARLQSEARFLAADSVSQAYLEDSVTLSAVAGNPETPPFAAVMHLQESRSAAVVSIAAATAAGRRAEADSCRRRAADMRREWQDAVRMLEQTEKVAGRTARGVPRAVTAAPAGPELPPLTLAPRDSTSVRAHVEAGFQAWKAAARQFRVPSADIDGRFIEALTAADAPELEPPVHDHHLRQAAWCALELGYRVRAEAARRLCAESWDEALELAGYRDQALWAMVDLERSIKEGVRRELDEERERMADREQALYESLKQFEGEFAKIRREARGTIMSLSDILFDFGKAHLRRVAELNLAKTAVIFQQFPEMSILIEGHTDNIGSEEYNLKLSERRARAVYDFLAEQGIPAERMETKGYGLSQPVETNATPEGRQANRRVDLVIREP